jgi:hypothetical protein
MTKRFFNESSNVNSIDIIEDNMRYKSRKEIDDILNNMSDLEVTRLNELSWRDYEKCGYYEIHEINEINEINRLNETAYSMNNVMNNNIINSRYHSKESNDEFYKKIICIINEEKSINLKFCMSNDLEKCNNNIILDNKEKRFSKFIFDKINFESLVIFDQYLRSINKRTTMVLA